MAYVADALDRAREACDELGMYGITAVPHIDTSARATGNVVVEDVERLLDRLRGDL